MVDAATAASQTLSDVAKLITNVPSWFLSGLIFLFAGGLLVYFAIKRIYMT